MDSFIFIDGWALVIVIALAILAMVSLILLGQWYLEEVHKNELLRSRITVLKEEKATLMNEYYRETFKVPEVGVDKDADLP